MSITFIVRLILLAMVSGACVSHAGGSSGAAVSTAAVSTAGASSALGCALPTLPFDINDANDDGEPYGGKTMPIEVPLWTWGSEAVSLDQVTLAGARPADPSRGPKGLSVQAVLTTSDASGGVIEVRTYYAEASIGQGESERAVMRNGGAVLEQQVARGKDAASVRNELGDLATLVRVGSFDAALVHSSPMPGDYRYYGLWWSDGRIDFHLSVNGSARDAIEGHSRSTAPE